MKNSVKFWDVSTIGVLIMLVFAFSLAGCATKKYTTEDFESETSQEIYRAASDLVVSRPGGITAGELVANLGKRIPGLKLFPMLGIQIDMIQLLYEKRHFIMECTMDWKNDPRYLRSVESGPGGGTVYVVGQDTTVTSIKSVIERKTTEVQPN